MSDPVVIDYETFYSRKLKYSLKTLIAETYCKHDLFDPYMIAVYDGKQSWVGRPQDFNWRALDGRDVLAHNAYFEATVTKELQARGWIPPVRWNSLTCTANMTAYLCQRRSLEEAVFHILGEKVDKSARADAENKKWPEGYTAAERDTMSRYALNDCIYTRRLWDKSNHLWTPVERESSRITIDQGMHGVQIDVDLLEQYIVQSHEMLMTIENVIPWIRDSEDEEWEEFTTKPTSSKCIAEQCRRDGIPCPPVKSEDEEAYELWENTYKDGRPWILALSAWRSVNKLYKTFLVMKSRLRDDGTMPFALLYFGAHTGRWSATAKVNFQNQRKKPIFCNEYGMLEMNEKRTDEAMRCMAKTGHWPEWVRYIIDFRRLILPRPGKKMIVSDLAQIEPRCLSWLTGDTALFDMLKRGIGIYEAHARNTMGWTGGSLKKENPTLYALAKVRVLGLGYGAGWEKFITMAATLSGGEIDLTAEDPEFVLEQDQTTGQMVEVSGYGTTSKRIVQEFRTGNAKIVDLWRRLDDGLRASAGQDFTIRLPSGRALKYERVRAERRIEPDKKTKKPTSRSVYTVGIGAKRVMTYGGKLTENLVQATARDVLNEQLVRMDKMGLRCLFTVHDECVMEVDQSVSADDVSQCMSYCPPWLEGCPISAEAHETPHYCK